MNTVNRSLLSEIRQIVFGAEDGMVSTMGAIIGLATASQNKSIVLVSGIVIIAVESLSMAAGTYLSNKSEVRAAISRHQKAAHKNPVIDSIYMGVSYVLGGSIALYPFWLLPIDWAISLSVTSVILALFTLGILSGRLTKSSPFRTGLEMVVVSLTAAAVGYAVGSLAGQFFPEIRV